MKNAIMYYYNLNPTEIHQIQDNYHFIILKKKYILYNTKLNQEQLNEIYILYKHMKLSGIFCHEIIINKNNHFITNINNKLYCLIEIRVKTRLIDLNDIEYYLSIPINNITLKNIKRDEWDKLWIKKIDFIEYQSKQIRNKQNFIQENLDYYIGLTENCISILNNMKPQKKVMTISHNRINKKTTTDDFYNPLTFILDVRTRDISEYIKSDKKLLKSEMIIKIIKNSKLTNDEIIYLFVRIMYPSRYLDEYEQIVMEKNANKKIKFDIDDDKKKLKDIYNLIKIMYNVPEIEWLNEN